MKKILLIYSIVVSHLLVAQSWTEVIPFPGPPLDDATSFSMGDFGYVITGMDAGFNTIATGYKYHAASYIWYPMDTLPAVPRQYSCAFTINNKAYLIGGLNGTTYLNDCWEYDPLLDSWTEKDSIPSFGRSACTCFAINGKGYIGTGATNGNTLTDEWWEYDPAVNTWTQKMNFPGGPRKVATGFAVNGKGYVLAGIDTNLTMHKDVWEYNPILDSWTAKNNFAGTPRFYGEGISIGNTGYLLTGWDSTQHYTNDLWQYNDVLDSWTALDTIPSFGRKGGSAFTINGNLFYTTGIDHNNNRLTETWAFGSTIGIEEEKKQYEILIYPNPSKENITIQFKSGLAANSIVIYNGWGGLLYTQSNPVFPIQISEVPSGTYFITIHIGNNILSKKFVVN